MTTFLFLCIHLFIHCYLPLICLAILSAVRHLFGAQSPNSSLQDGHDLILGSMMHVSQIQWSLEQEKIFGAAVKEEDEVEDMSSEQTGHS
jgi:hypothetical protein